MKFEQTMHPDSPRTVIWRSLRGFWSFLISHDLGRDEGYFTSYRDARIPIQQDHKKSPLVAFNGTRELRGMEMIPLDFAYRTLADAMRACEEKYREILLR